MESEMEFDFIGKWKTRSGALAVVFSSHMVEPSIQTPKNEIIYLGTVDLGQENIIPTYWNMHGNSIYTKFDLVDRVRGVS